MNKDYSRLPGLHPAKIQLNQNVAQNNNHLKKKVIV